MKTQKFLISMALCLCLVLTSSFALAAGYTAGTYSAEAKGNNGPVSVSVTVSANAITAVEITAHAETPTISDLALERIPAGIVEKQSLAVDAVTGATNTSNAILAAVEACLVQAGADIGALKVAVPVEEAVLEQAELTADLVIVGAGGTGLSAAASALDNGVKSIIVLEKLPSVGGSTKLAGGALGAPGTIYQAAAGITDTPQDWFDYWMLKQEEGSLVESQYPDEERLMHLITESVETVEWIGETIGLEYATPRQFGEGGVSRAHVAKASPVPPSGRGSSGGGRFIVEALHNYVKDDPEITIMTETMGTELITNEAGDVVGVKAVGDKEYTINAKAVILATGSFAHNAEMLESYIPGTSYYKFASISSACPGDTGDGMRMAIAVGAVPYEDPWIMGLSVTTRVSAASSALSTINGFKDNVCVDQNGRRFVNEDVAYITSSVAAVDTAWEIIDSADPARAEILETNMEGVEIVKGNTWEELAAAMGADPAVLTETMTRYAEAVKTGVDTEFNKRAEFLVPLETAPFYAVKLCPVTGGTLGGVKTNEKFQVQREDGSIIKGLYAGGECANKIYYNRVYTSGSGLTIATTSGRIAGKTVAEEINK